MDQIYYRKNSRGLIEGVDMTTNEIVCVQHSELALDPLSSRLSKIILPNGKEVYIEKGLLVKGRGVNELFPERGISPVLADMLVQFVVEGKTLRKACQALNIEYSVVNTWKSKDDKFKERLEIAMHDRAEYFHDEIIETAEASRDPKLKIEALKWSNEKNSPEKYSPKSKITGDKNAPLHFVLSTGIDRGENSSPTAEKEILPGHASGDQASLPPAVDSGIVATPYTEFSEKKILDPPILNEKAFLDHYLPDNSTVATEEKK